MSKKVRSREEIVRLISQYEQHPELWDTQCKDYHNKVKKNSTLQILAAEFDTTDTEINKKLHNLKTSTSSSSLSSSCRRRRRYVF